VSDPDALPGDRVSLFIGRPGTLAALCPPVLGDLLRDLAPGEGIVASMDAPALALLVGGADAGGLAAAVQALATGALAAAPSTTLPAAGGNGEVSGEVVRIGATPPVSAVPQDDTPASLPPLRSLADLYGPAGLAVDTDDDLLPDYPRTSIVLPSDLAPHESVAVAHLGARLGLESLGLALPLARRQDGTPLLPGQLPIVVGPLDPAAGLASDTGTVRLLNTADGRQRVQVAGSDTFGRGAALAALAALDAWERKGRQTLATLEHDLSRVCALADPGAALAAIPSALAHLAQALPEPADTPLSLAVGIPVTPTLDAGAAARCITRWAEQAFPGRPCSVEITPAAPAMLLDETERFTWEVDDAWTHLRTAVLPALAALPPRADWLIDVRLSEPAGRREALRAALAEEIRATGRAVERAQVRVLPAYHQGRAWLLEEVLPHWHGLPVQDIVIRVQRFTLGDHQGQAGASGDSVRGTHAANGAGETPALPAGGTGEAIEPPIRWLQDLFGVDELLAARLNLPLTAIRFELVDGPHTYEVEVFDAAGQRLWQDSFDAVHTTWPYLLAFPAWGSVHPPTGCVRLWSAGAPIVDLPLATDPERIWHCVQDRILPVLETHIRQVCAGTPRRDRQPFFGELTVDAWLSEEDEPLGIRQERNSPLENLHEDLYFVVLDFCAALIGNVQDPPYAPPWTAAGAHAPRSQQARRWTAPGRVVPRIHRHDGAAPEVRVRLSAAAPHPALHWRCGDTGGSLALEPAAGVAPRVMGLQVHGAQQTLLLALDGSPEARAHAHRILSGWADLHAAGALIAGGPWAKQDLRLVIDDTLHLSIPAMGIAEDVTATGDGQDARAPSGRQAHDALTGTLHDAPATTAASEKSAPPASQPATAGAVTALRPLEQPLVGSSATRPQPEALMPAGGYPAIRIPMKEPENDSKNQRHGSFLLLSGREARGLHPEAVSEDVPLPWDRVLGLADIEARLPLLAAAPEVHAFEAGRSAGGLPSYALEITVPRTTGWWSRARLCGWKATLLLNARHHANEPSSTTGLLYLAGLLTGDPQWRRVLDRVNVVLIPGENVDGMALYDTLQDEHPTWMHHAARYNAAGLEFAAAYTNPLTPHTEALVLPGLWRQWAPDIVCDDHGFPAHAWVQPFAGGSNPWFAAFFIPQALVYGIMPVAQSPRFPHHGTVADALCARLVDALATDPEIARWNNAHADRYRTYANNWLPERFPVTYDRGVLMHRSTFDPAAREASLGDGGLPGAFPGVTTLSITTEVADETAQGTYMALCARAHVIFDQVLLQYLYAANPPATVRRTAHVQPDGSVLLRTVRPRPLLPLETV
jgi:hypothetical protein